MKRIALGLITLSLAGMAMAQTEPASAPPAGKLDISITGVFYPAVAYGSSAPTAVWGPSWVGYPGTQTPQLSGGTYNSFKLSYSAADYGLYADERFSLDTLNLSLYSAAVWYKFNDALKLTLGKINNGEYSEFSQLAGDQLESKFFNEELGALVQVYPTAPLSLAAAYYVPGSENSGSDSLPATTKRNPADNLGFAASYKLGDSGIVHGFYKSYQKPTDSATLKLVDFGGNYAPSKDWYFSAAYEYDFSTEADGDTANALNDIYVGAKFTGISQVTVTLDYNVDTGTQNGGSSKTYQYIEGAVEYALPSSPLAIGLQAGYDSGIANVVWEWQGNGLEGGTDDFTSIVGGVEIYPYVQYNFKGGPSVRAGFLYLSGGVDDTASGGPSDTKSTWAVPVTYNINF